MDAAVRRRGGLARRGGAAWKRGAAGPEAQHAPRVSGLKAAEEEHRDEKPPGAASAAAAAAPLCRLRGRLDGDRSRARTHSRAETVYRQRRVFLTNAEASFRVHPSFSQAQFPVGCCDRSLLLPPTAAAAAAAHLPQRPRRWRVTAACCSAWAACCWSPGGSWPFAWACPSTRSPWSSWDSSWGWGARACWSVDSA